MIFFRKPVPTFRDHALADPNKSKVHLRALLALAVAAGALGLAAISEAAPDQRKTRGPGARAAGVHRPVGGINSPNTRFTGQRQVGNPGVTNSIPNGSGERIAHPQAGGQRFARPGFGRSGAGRPGFGRAGFNRQFANRGAFGQRGVAARIGGRGYARNWGPLPGEPGFTGVPPAGETRFIQNEMVVHVGAEVSPQTMQGVATRLGLTTVGTQDFGLFGRTIYRFRISGGRSVADVVRAMEAEKLSVTAQPNYVFRLQQDLNSAHQGSPSDSIQYIVSKWRLNEVHRMVKGTGVLVAMIDSEVDQRHPDLAGSIAARLEPTGQEFPPQVHGTGMAGAMTSHRRLTGVAPGAKILAVNAFGTDEGTAYGTTEQILKGIDWAISKGAKVINMSFAGPRDPLVQLALKKAYDKGIVLVAAAGNAGPKSEPLFPAADPNVIAVTATDVNDALLPQANQGEHISVAAPGVDILVPAPNAQYQITSGTSVAAAEVSGVVALLLERKRDADPTAIRKALQDTAKDLGPRGRDDKFGWGLVDPYQAVLSLELNVANAPQQSSQPQH
jgi:hypothetical protein